MYLQSRTTLGELTALSQLPKLVGMGLAAQEPFPPLSVSEVSPKDMGSMSYQNCCKGFLHFTEMVEKHWSTPQSTRNKLY